MNQIKPVLPATPSFGEGMALLWIVSTAIYYYLNFSMVFYQSNQSAIEHLLRQLGFTS